MFWISVLLHSSESSLVSYQPKRERWFQGSQNFTTIHVILTSINCSKQYLVPWVKEINTQLEQTTYQCQPVRRSECPCIKHGIGKTDAVQGTIKQLSLRICRLDTTTTFSVYDAVFILLHSKLYQSIPNIFRKETEQNQVEEVHRSLTGFNVNLMKNGTALSC